MKEKIIKKINKLLNKQVFYGSHLCSIVDYDLNDERGRLYIWTDHKKDPYDRPYDSALVFLEEFREVSNAPAVVNNGPQEGMLITGPNNLALQLKEILLDNIERVKENPDYIPQAEAVSTNVNAMINLVKVQVDYIKATKKIEQDF